MRVEPTVPADVLAAIRSPFEGAGAERADAPLLQPLNLLLDLAGEAMRARLFVVQSEGGTESCLRPDFTVAIARQHIEAGAADGRYYYQGAAFRASTDRPEEFVQVGLEMFSPAPSERGGGGSEVADAEIAALAWQAAAAGGRDDLSLWLGDVALFAAFVNSLGLADGLATRLARMAGRPRLLTAELARASAPAGGGGALAGMLAGVTAAQATTLIEEVWALAGVEPVGGRGPAEIAERLVRKAEVARAPALTEAEAHVIQDFLAISDAPMVAFQQMRDLAGDGRLGLDFALDAWSSRLEQLARTVPAEHMRFTPALGHAFAYYDGITFEVRSAAVGPDRAVATGGRYDGLLARLGGGGSGRAVGCMVRPWRAYAGGEA